MQVKDYFLILFVIFTALIAAVSIWVDRKDGRRTNYALAFILGIGMGFPFAMFGSSILWHAL